MVNQELDQLDNVLSDLPACMAPGGATAIISYHSGEDRRVKQAYAAYHDRGLLTSYTKKPITPGKDEQQSNRASTSAKMRVAWWKQKQM